MQDRNTSVASNSPGARLVDTLDETGFFQSFWEHDRLVLPGFFAPADIEEIFPLEKFDALLMSGGLMHPHLDLVRAGAKIAAPFTVSPSPGTDIRRIAEELKSGATVRVAHIEQHMFELADVCRTLEARIGAPVRANLYITPPFSQGFAPHFDLDDIFVIQLVGSKTWVLHDEYTAKVALPGASQAFSPLKHRSTRPGKALDLSLGDVLYLPRGFMHEARSNHEASIHVTFAVVGATVAKLVQQMIANAAEEDEALRRLLVLPMLSDPEGAAGLKETLTQLFGKLQMEDVIPEAARRLQAYCSDHRPPNMQGWFAAQLRSQFQAGDEA